MQSELMQIPIRLMWAGWETTTWRLRNSKWQLFANQQMDPNAYRYLVRVTCKSPKDDFLITGTMVIDPRNAYGNILADHLYSIPIEMQQYKVGDRCIVYEQQKFDWDSLNASLPFDGFANVPHRDSFNFHELKLFNFKENAQEIYIPLETVDDCLNKILQIQRPQVLQMNKKVQEVQAPKILAKVYSLAA